MSSCNSNYCCSLVKKCDVEVESLQLISYTGDLSSPLVSDTLALCVNFSTVNAFVFRQIRRESAGFLAITLQECAYTTKQCVLNFSTVYSYNMEVEFC